MINIESLRSFQDSPDPLILLCLNDIIKRPVNPCRYMLPPELGDLIAVAFRDHALANRLTDAQCIEFFKRFHPNYIPLTRINFSGLPITEEFFMEFLEDYKDQLEEIDISSCRNLRNMNMKRLNQLLKSNSTKDKSLIIGETFSEMIESRKSVSNEILFDMRLKKLVLQRIYSTSYVDEYTINTKLSDFLSPIMNLHLKYLDLSMCSIGRGSALIHLAALEILILYNCSVTYPDVISTICQLKNIRVLDLSRQAIEVDDISSTTEDPKLLDLLVKRLPHLTRLDISGTNLVGGKDRNISAFETRVDKPFEFLGLFHTGNDAAYRSCIPAACIAGEATESQMLNACEAYMDRPGQLSRALNDLYNFYKTITPSETFDDINRALDVVLPILTKHLSDEQVIISATAALWCIVKINITSKNLTDARVRRTITSRLLDVMHYHKSRVILINGGLSLLLLPDIICEHSRVAAISLFMCRDKNDPRTQGFGTTLLNTLACQVGGDQKVYIGRLNAIETMIDIIRAKIAADNCDEIMETAWSTLWNITDETPVNCLRFLEYGGLEAFENCMDQFGNNKEVLRNIMGLLGNVAECQKLRINFMDERYIRRFYILLTSEIDGIECCYNACGILAHLISEGETFWSKHVVGHLTRRSVLEKMYEAISKWKINSNRNINYRSFEPIIRLLDLNIDAPAQYWAVFALTNLTRINPVKYCPMLLPYNGLEKLRLLAERELLVSEGSNEAVWQATVKNLASVAVYQFERFEAEKTLAGLEQCTSVNLEEVEKFRLESDIVEGELGDWVLL